MPQSIVVDSGILLKTVQIEEYTEMAKSLIADIGKSQIAVHAPTLFRYELVAVVRKWVYRNFISPQKAEAALSTVLEYSITLHFDEALLKRGYELATKYNRPTAYDAQYLALAERLACDFWTADERLFNAVKEAFPQVHWLGNWQPSQEE